MSTIDELLNEQLEEEEDLICHIDKETRKINMHEACKFFGVEHDKKVERIKFKCAKEVGDEKVDLMQCQTLIAYENANGEPGLYNIDDMYAEGDVVYFSWLFDEDVTLYKGDVKFIFYACRLNGEEKEIAWNTIPATGFVEEGLEVTAQIEERNPAIIESMLLRIGNLEKAGSADVDERLAELEQNVADLMYEPIDITKFECNPSVAEIGRVVTGAVLSWEINKQPVVLTLDGVEIAPGSSGEHTISQVRKDTTWVLAATDERGKKDEKIVSLHFINGIYYGAAAEPSDINTPFVLNLENQILSENKNRTVKITNGGTDKYAWYAYPTRLGESLFNIGGFDYDFEVTITRVMNPSRYIEDYYVYRSAQYVPETLSITIKDGG